MKLSILIPTYSFLDGIRRICHSLEKNNISEEIEVQVIIFDDSPNSDIEIFIKSWTPTGISVLYRRNIPALGPALNWNALIEEAKGEFCLLMHHDEFPVNDNFLMLTINELNKTPNIDVLLLDCVLFSQYPLSARRHLPGFLRLWIVIHAPDYLLRRNVIGPTSTIIVRKSLYPSFDSNLKWLIDVDLYYQIRQSTSKWRLTNNITIGSLVDRSDSITEIIRNDIKLINRNEKLYLSHKYTKSSIWLTTSFSYTLLAETFFWTSIRVIFRICSALRRFMQSDYPVALNSIKRIFKK